MIKYKIRAQLHDERAWKSGIEGGGHCGIPPLPLKNHAALAMSFKP
jgi:hypothetical protein